MLKFISLQDCKVQIISILMLILGLGFFLLPSLGYAAGGQTGNQPPVAVCANISVNADADCELKSLRISSLTNGSYDPDGDLMSYSLSFRGPYPVGDTEVVITLDDGNGGVSQCTSIVTVRDVTSPVAMARNAYLVLDSQGAASVTLEDVDAGSYDDCQLESLELSQYQFDCSDIGENEVILTARDAFGNVSLATAIVTVVDESIPTVSASFEPYRYKKNKIKKYHFAAAIAVDAPCPDLVDSKAVIALPNISGFNIQYESTGSKKGKDSKYLHDATIKIDFKKRTVKVKAHNAEEYLEKVMTTGGIAIETGHVAKYKYKEKYFEAKIKDGKLYKIYAPEVSLQVVSINSSGLQATASAHLVLGSSKNEDDQEKEEDDEDDKEKDEEDEDKDDEDEDDDDDEYDDDKHRARVAATDTQRITKIYPNPTDGVFNVSISAESKHTVLSLYDLSGSLIQQKLITEHQDKVQMGQYDLQSGIYLLQIIEEGVISRHRVVIGD